MHFVMLAMHILLFACEMLLYYNPFVLLHRDHLSSSLAKNIGRFGQTIKSISYQKFRQICKKNVPFEVSRKKFGVLVLCKKW